MSSLRDYCREIQSHGSEFVCRDLIARDLVREMEESNLPLTEPPSNFDSAFLNDAHPLSYRDEGLRYNSLWRDENIYRLHSAPVPVAEDSSPGLIAGGFFAAGLALTATGFASEVGIPLMLLGAAGCHREADRPSPGQNRVVLPVPSPSTPHNPWNLQQTGNIRLQVDLEGDPQQGSILFIRQIHAIEEDLQAEGPTAHLVKVGLYQFYMLRLLEELHPQDIFLEGLSHDLSHEGVLNNISDDIGRQNMQFAERLFLGDLPDRPSADYLARLASLDAARIYAFRHAEAVLHRVMTPSEKEIVRRELFSDPNIDVVNHPINAQREQWAVREMLEVLHNGEWQRTHPERRIALIYGGTHSFCDDFLRTASSPHVTSVWWRLRDPELRELTRFFPPGCRR